MTFNEQLNSINIKDWRTDPNVIPQLGDTIENESWKRSAWQSLVGQGSQRAIRTFERKKVGAHRPRMKTPLKGSGVVGNANLDSNLDQLEFYAQTIYPRVVANASISEIKEYMEIQEVDYIKEATESHTDWATRMRDKNLSCALANDFTNAVVCDSKNGFKDMKGAASIAEVTKTIQEDDFCNVKAIRRAIFMARNGRKYNGERTFSIRPTRASVVRGDGMSFEHYSYIILLDGFAAAQLRNDVEWIEMQKYAGVRGDENNLFSGLLGIIDGCLVVDMGIWNDYDAGMVNSEVSDAEFRNCIDVNNHKLITPPSYYTGNNPICVGALIGAGALVMSGEYTTKMHIADEDADRKLLVGASKLLAIAKARFDQSVDGRASTYFDQDMACIGIFSSMKEV